MVYLAGGRQTGKSTLTNALVSKGITLDESAPLQAARSDPDGFISGFVGLTLIDEVQRAPELFLAIKRLVDRDRSSQGARFLLTGSANPLLLPNIADSLAGRMEILTLWGFAQSEITSKTKACCFGESPTFVDWLFGDSKTLDHLVSDDEWHRRACTGGFPEVVLTRTNPRRRAAWFDSYLNSFIQRDLRDLANISGAVEMPMIIKLLAARVSQPLNIADLARQTSIPPTTLRRYLALLEMTYFVQQLPAWAVNLGKRVTKAPKILLSDSGLLCHLLGKDEKGLEREPVVFGPILENFVANELIRQASWSEISPSIFHFRAHSGEEVDLILESRDCRVVAIEVKATKSLGRSDWKNLRFLRDTLGERFHRGIVLYRGEQSIPLAEKLQAVPLSALLD